MRELVYEGSVQGIIEARFPGCRIEDASDYIHEGRFLVEVDAGEDDFYPFAIAEGFALCCLNFQMMMRMGEHIRVKRWMKMAEELTQERRQ